MEKYIKLLQDYLAGIIDAEELRRQYLGFRSSDLDTSTADPDLLERFTKLKQDAFAGRITSEEFEQEFPEVSQKVYLSSGKDILQFTNEGKILLGELMSTLDCLEADPATHGDLVIHEPEFRNLVEGFLDRLRDP